MVIRGMVYYCYTNIIQKLNGKINKIVWEDQQICGWLQNWCHNSRTTENYKDINEKHGYAAALSGVSPNFDQCLTCHTSEPPPCGSFLLPPWSLHEGNSKSCTWSQMLCQTKTFSDFRKAEIISTICLEIIQPPSSKGFSHFRTTA